MNVCVMISYVRKDLFDQMAKEEENMKEMCKQVLLQEDLDTIQKENESLESNVQGEYKEYIDLYNDLSKRIHNIEV